MDKSAVDLEATDELRDLSVPTILSVNVATSVRRTHPFFDISNNQLSPKLPADHEELCFFGLEPYSAIVTQWYRPNPEGSALLLKAVSVYKDKARRSSIELHHGPARARTFARTTHNKGAWEAFLRGPVVEIARRSQRVSDDDLIADFRARQWLAPEGSTAEWIEPFDD